MTKIFALFGILEKTEESLVGVVDTKKGIQRMGVHGDAELLIGPKRQLLSCGGHGTPIFGTKKLQHHVSKMRIEKHTRDHSRSEALFDRINRGHSQQRRKNRQEGLIGKSARRFCANTEKALCIRSQL